jgi:hypothetical protein
MLRMVSLFSLRVLEIIEMPTVFEIFQNQKLYHIELSNLNVYLYLCYTFFSLDFAQLNI